MAVPRQPKPVQFRTFGLNPEASPDIEDLITTQDPENLKRALELAGLTRLTAMVGPIQKAEQAAQTNVELASADWERYRTRLIRTARPETYDGMLPPPEARVALQLARKAELFDTIQMLSTQDDTETLVVGIVESARPRYFLVAQWGTQLTSVDDLHNQYRLRGMRSRLQRWLSRNAEALSLGSVVLILGSILLPLNLISWWLYMPILIGMMSWCGVVVARTSPQHSFRLICGWVIASQLALGIVIGGVKLYTWNTTPRTIEATVCGVGDRPNIITTSRGDFALEAGQYNGAYEAEPTDSLARSLVGHAVLLTIHGHNLAGHRDGTYGPFVTKATTIGIRQCGSS